ncbi:hypothetical protein IAU60_003070 [Kwoniella sp. DSM 27419]
MPSDHPRPERRTSGSRRSPDERGSKPRAVHSTSHGDRRGIKSEKEAKSRSDSRSKHKTRSSEVEPPGHRARQYGSKGQRMASKSSDMRYYVLHTSGGWLGNLVIALSDLTGLWELVWLVILFVVSWVILRSGQVEVTLILGHVYDLTIPLQHQLNPSKKGAHAAHLDHYWPIFLIGTLVEFGSFVSFHPDLFTLVACLKTLILLCIWLARDSRGRYFTESLGRPQHGIGKEPDRKRTADPTRRSETTTPEQNDRSSSKRDRPTRRRTRPDDDLKQKATEQETEVPSAGKRPRRDKQSGEAGTVTTDTDSEIPTSPGSSSFSEASSTPDSDTSEPPSSANLASDTDRGGGDPTHAKRPSGATGKRRGLRDAYDSRGFEGNLMPVRKQRPRRPVREGA